MILAALLAIAGALLLPARLRGQPPAPGLTAPPLTLTLACLTAEGLDRAARS
jgi:hypothetical protein